MNRSERVAFFKRQLDMIKSQKEALEREMSAVNNELDVFEKAYSQLTHSTPKAVAKPQARPKTRPTPKGPKIPVKTLIMNALADGKVLTVAEIAEQTFAQYTGKQSEEGYKSQISTTLFNMRKDDKVTQPERGKWAQAEQKTA